MTLSRGIYQIRNAGVPVAMDLHDGSSNDGNRTKIAGWQFGDGINWNQLWLLEPVSRKTDTFTVRSLIAGTYMDLSGGSRDNGPAPIIGWPRTGTNQEWIIKQSAGNQSYKMKNYASGTFADLHTGGSSNGTPIHGCQGSDFHVRDNNFHQRWLFKRMSLSSAEIETIIGRNPHLVRNYKSYQVDREYLILPRNIWGEIWNSTDLRDKNRRREIFDCNDFALVMKAAVSQWGADKWRADGFAIFCGLMLGRSQSNPREGHAYNFTISDDHSGVVFFDPQTNEFMDNIDCDAFLAYV
ncbi:Moa, A lectin from the mushroom marasmius Oreades in complex with the trisaccharide Galgalglcnac [Armillaria gallica]|uniref:Moa, A lectin from the mushroom marasmius Oreades in complex with the trisaccharide Galgalglcnac n=1 Tax=Armillaria gallica TaxID=47427 RepID=A0A2H3F1K9_ARMGA|nr:Moa, A lectin from the mushroom marasmius Oreades in complex with the trisaccharide Galgalglcnac [Armillaria gallica]